MMVTLTDSEGGSYDKVTVQLRGIVTEIVTMK